ncbi:MAG TPA: FtsQ-type POTRA domain-containing protein [Terracidiphilus sp.]
MADPDAEDELPRRRRQFEKPSGPWYRPESKLGRTLLVSGALIVVGALTTGIIFLRNALERDGRFRIAGTGNIQAAGLTQVSRSEILPVFGEDIGKNIFFIHLDERRQQLEQIPWIEKATVMRILPDRIRVSVVERTPIAFVREGQQIELVDADGVLLNMSAEGMTRHHYSFPVVTGIDPRDPAASRKARMAVYQRLIGDLDSAGQHLSQQISEIDLTDPEDARVLMPEQGADILAHFGDDQFLTRYQRYRAHIGEWRQQYPRLASVDLRYDNDVVLQMAPGSGATAAAVNASDGKPAVVAEAGAKSPAKASSSAAGSKPSPASRSQLAAQPAIAPLPTPAAAKAVAATHKSALEHKTQPRHVVKAGKTAGEREKEKREAAHKAALRRQHTSSLSNTNGRQEQ